MDSLLQCYTCGCEEMWSGTLCVNFLAAECMEACISRLLFENQYP